MSFAVIVKERDDGFRHVVLDCNYDKVSRDGVSDSVEVIVMNYEEQI